MDKKKQNLSSYEKGIRKLLEKSEGFEWIIANYVIDTHNKFRSNVFPTTQIAKVVLNKLNKKKTKYAIIHKIVREIFNIYEEDEICERITSRSSKSKKTKKIYRITDYGFKVLKSKVIGFNIENIRGNIKQEFEPSSRSREDYVMDYVQDFIDEFDDYCADFDECEY
ncbi:MAG: hypothetical protein GF364_04150 [Candidatus Lokiarchaeota archaeon]|nr:hypothetical protein [Candidatus Lokiarchaeota archaeon]